MSCGTGWLLPLLLSTAAAGIPCFVDSRVCIKKGIIQLKPIHEEKVSDLSDLDDVRMKPASSEKLNTILGKERSAVPVFVRVYSKSLTLKCTTEELLMQRIFDPRYKWNGPNGVINKDSPGFFLDDRGSLMFYNIHGSDSGSYRCIVTYTLHNKEVVTEIHFIVYAYHIPVKSIQLSSNFRTNTCENKVVALCERELLQDFVNLVRDLRCEIQKWKAHCTIAANPVGKLTHQLTFQFVVFPFVVGYADACKSSDCESSIKKAYMRIKQFLQCQNSPLKHSISMHYSLGSLNGTKVIHCKPGYGKMMESNSICPGCCIACPPGKHSSGYGTSCIACSSGAYNSHYGQTVCTHCPEQKTSNKEGAISEKECHKKLPMRVILLITCLGTSFLLWASWIVAQKCFRRTFASQYIQESEPGVKKKLRNMANIANNTSIKEQRSKLINPFTRQMKKKFSKFKSGFSDEQSVELLNSDEVSEASTLSRRGPSPEMSYQRESESSFAESKSQYTSYDS